MIGPEKLTFPKAIGGRIADAIRASRWYEQEMLSYIAGLKRRGTYIDVGANIGNHTAFFASNTRAEQIVSIEPDATVYAMLSEMVSANRLHTKIRTINAAASDKPGTISFNYAAGRNKMRTGKIAAVVIDDLNLSNVTVVKIDVEGAETSVLRGMAKTIVRDKPVIFAEALSDDALKDIVAVLRLLGYKATGRKWNASPTYEFVAA